MATKRIEFTTPGYWGEWTQSILDNGIAWSQSITPGERFKITSAKFKMWKVGVIESIWVGVVPTCSPSSHIPDINASVLADVIMFDTSGIPTSAPGSYIEFTFDVPANLEKDTKYAIVIVVYGAGTLNIIYNVARVFAGGQEAAYPGGYVAKGIDPYEEVNWTHYSQLDFFFEVWGNTADIVAPTVYTYDPELNQENPHKVIAKGHITGDGGAKITNRAFRYYKDGLPEVTYIVEEDGEFEQGAFSLEVTDLEYNQKYFVRAEATNIIGTSVGEYVEFTTLYPESSQKIEIKAEAKVTDEEFFDMGGGEALTIQNHLIQTKALAQSIADYYLAEFKNPKIVIRGNIVTPAPYERGDTIIFGEGEVLLYTTYIKGEINYKTKANAVKAYNYYDIARYGRMNLRKINPIFSAGNYTASIELEKKI